MATWKGLEEQHPDAAAVVGSRTSQSTAVAIAPTSELPCRAGFRRLVVAACTSAVLFAAWSKYISRIARRPSKWGSGRFAMVVAAALVWAAKSLGITCYNEVVEKANELPPDQVLACWHPHGLYVLTPLLFHSSGPRNHTTRTYGWFTMVAEACFMVPVLREILTLVNVRVADNKIIDHLLGMGKSVYICPGGIHEQLATDPEQEQVFFPPNLGFVKLAIKHGLPLVPTYHFGEGQLYDVPEWSRAVSTWLRKNLRVGIPFGIGRWGIPFLPKQQHISIRVGNLIYTGEPEAAPSEEQIKEVFFRYCLELLRLFEEFKESDLAPDVAARGLRLVWRGHESEDLSTQRNAEADGAALVQRQPQSAAPVQDEDSRMPPEIYSRM